MIEFENWAKTKKPYDPFCCHGMMEAAWKAALKWSQGINKEKTEEYQDSSYGAIKQSIAIDVELRGE